jgi:hypothetical protein
MCRALALSASLVAPALTASTAADSSKLTGILRIHRQRRLSCRAGVSRALGCGSTRRHRCSFALAAALSCGLATVARTEVRVEGSLAAVRVTTDQDAIADVLSAFAATFNVKYRTAIPLSAPANTTYAGPFGQVVSRLLDGYNFVVKTNEGTTEIVVLGRRGEAVVQPAAPHPTPSNGIIERWPAAPKGTQSKTITEPWR